MGTKRNKPTDVNKVRRLSASQDINLGMSRAKDLEDEIKRPRRKATTLDTNKHTRVPTAEDDYIRKGRKLKAEKQKEYKDRHAPRKTDVEKEFTKELQKIRKRVRYREKQGFKVHWETVPSRPTRITQADVEKLKQYALKLNEAGDIEVYRYKYNKNAKELPPKLRIKYTDLPNYKIENDPNFVPPAESVQNFDVFKRIEDTLIYDKSLVQNEGTELDHPMNEDVWVAISNMVDESYDIALTTFRSLRESPKRQEYADYLVAHENEITTAIDDNLYVSTQEQALSARTEMLQWLQM